MGEVHAAVSARDLSAQALDECQKGRLAQARETRLAHFDRSQALAERAVALDDRLADGHFALVCSLGEKMRTDGQNLASLLGLRKFLASLDRTLALNPNHLEALSCKGTALIKLPRLLGGDRDKGEQILRRVIHQAPQKAVNARLVLARSYADRGRRQEAVTLAQEALSVARSLDRKDLIREAEETWGQLNPGSESFPQSRTLLARP